MSSIRTMVRSATFALAFALTAAPFSAFADEGPDDEVVAAKAPGRRDDHGPMKAAKFRKIVAKRIGHARARVEHMLDAHGVPALFQRKIRKDFEDGAAQVEAAADRAAKDGAVTKEEAREVRELAKELKREMQEKYLPGSESENHPGKGKGRGRTDRGQGRREGHGRSSL